MLLAFALLLTACTPGGSDRASDIAPPKAANLELGRRIYNYRCHFCHGYSGDAQTLASSYISPRPRDFIHTAPAQLSREHMLEAIRNGRAGTAMKDFSDILQPAEMEAVTDFVRQEFMTAKGRDAYGLPRAASRQDLDRPLLFDVISAGKRGTEMPAWDKVLNRQEFTNVAEFVFRRFLQLNDMNVVPGKGVHR